MSIIDWSDPEEMLGLLVESVQDELTAEQSDRERARFLRSLSAALADLASRAPLSASGVLTKLRAVADAQPRAFVKDPAFVHVEDCIEELERIVGQASR